MEALTTPRLLAYKRSLMKVVEKPNWDEPTAQIYKASEEWRSTYEEAARDVP